MKKKYIIIIVILLCLVYIGYKFYLLREYQVDYEILNNEAIFNEKLIVNRNNDKPKKSIDEFFDGYVPSETDSSWRIKRNSNNEVISYYSFYKSKQYNKLLSVNAFMFDIEEKTYETEDNMKKYLEKNNINDDIDLLNHIKENYYFKNNIFTCTKTMRNNFILNMFAISTLPGFDNIVLLDGNTNGYIININRDSDEFDPIKEIHLLDGDNQYIIILFGNELTNDKFVTYLIENIEFN